MKLTCNEVFKVQLMKYLKEQFHRYSSTKVFLMCSNAYCYIILPFLMSNNITERGKRGTEFGQQIKLIAFATC